MKKIIPTGQYMPWVDAQATMKSKGGLPSNALHDDYLVMSEKYKELQSGYYAAWCREVIIYPEKNGVFHEGLDVEDEYTDNNDRTWILLAKDIPKNAIGKQGIALFIDPKNVEITNDKVIIHPKKITVINAFPQKDGWYGYDPTTRIPIEKKYGNEFKDKRYLWRRDGISVRPLARCDGFDGNGRRDVFAGGGQGYGLGVAYVKPSGKEAKHKHHFVCECGKVRR